MIQIALIFVWIGAGLLLRRAGATHKTFARLNHFIVCVPLPATVLLALHNLYWEPSYWIPVSMAWLVFLGSIAFFSFVGRLNGWSTKMVGALVMTAGLGNTAFVGYPLLRAMYGESAIPIAVLTDQPGSFLVLATLGIASASFFSSGRASPQAIAKRMARFPPLWALAAALLLRPWPFPNAVDSLLHMGLRTLVPLALISVGGGLRFDHARLQREKKPVAIALLYKLVLAPLTLALFLVVFLGHRGDDVRITLIESAMGPMVTGAIVAEEHGLDAELCSLIVSLGIPLCLITVPLWAKLLEVLGV